LDKVIAGILYLASVNKNEILASTNNSKFIQLKRASTNAYTWNEKEYT